nr:hypothetical protein [uncultured Arsenicibacter sp.]
MKKPSKESLQQLEKEVESDLICVAIFENASADDPYTTMHIINQNLTYDHLHCLAHAIVCEMNTMRKGSSYVIVSPNEIISLN